MTRHLLKSTRSSALGAWGKGEFSACEWLDFSGTILLFLRSEIQFPHGGEREGSYWNKLFVYFLVLKSPIQPWYVFWAFSEVRLSTQAVAACWDRRTFNRLSSIQEVNRPKRVKSVAGIFSCSTLWNVESSLIHCKSPMYLSIVLDSAEIPSGDLTAQKKKIRPLIWDSIATRTMKNGKKEEAKMW